MKTIFTALVMLAAAAAYFGGILDTADQAAVDVLSEALPPDPEVEALDRLDLPQR